MRFAILILLIFVIDIYVFRTITNQFSSLSKLYKYLIYTFYWLIPIIAIALGFYGFSSKNIDYKEQNIILMTVVSIIVLFYLPKLIIFVFQLIEDLTKFLAFITKKLSKSGSTIHSGADKISRSVFVGRVGLILASIPFVSVLYGIIKGRFNFNVQRHSIYSKNLPAAFDGFKVLQFSDFHSGSLIGQQEKFKHAVELMNNEKVDIIVFTGDIVNNIADEIVDWIDVLSKLESKYGKFSILGNHDYGEYHRWNNANEKEENLERLKQYHKQMGFRLLLNENHVFEKSNDKIALLGVENWGEKPFPQFGRLDLAMKGVENIPFKILLSHDPSHWDKKVLNKTDIDLTLSGHTHGMQMAINLGNISWSPVSFKYPRWKGLYKENNQYLYVNIGLGYIAFPGRVGTDPEITVFELKKEA